MDNLKMYDEDLIADDETLVDSEEEKDDDPILYKEIEYKELPRKKRRYILLVKPHVSKAGMPKKDIIKNLKEFFNCPENVNGEYAQVILASKGEPRSRLQKMNFLTYAKQVLESNGCEFIFIK